MIYSHIQQYTKILLMNTNTPRFYSYNNMPGISAYTCIFFLDQLQYEILGSRVTIFVIYTGTNKIYLNMGLDLDL